MDLSALLASRTVLVQLAALAFVLLAKLGLILPGTMTPAAFVAAGLLVLTAVTAVRRFHIGDDGDAKAWWQSKMIWAQIVAAIFAVFALFGKLGSLDQVGVVESVMAVVALANIFFRLNTTKAIA